MRPVAHAADGSFLRYTLIPIFFLVTCPFWNVTLWMLSNLDHSLYSYFQSPSLYVASIPRPSPAVFAAILGFFIFEGLLLRFLPGRTFTGPVSPTGEIPVYRENGHSALFVTWVVYFGLSLAGAYPVGIIYDYYGEGIVAMNLIGYVITILLYLRGRVSPTCRDCQPSGRGMLFDLFWGMELYPKLFGLPLKQWVNCRCAMMQWALVTPMFLFKQMSLHGEVSSSMLISTFLLTAYLVRFFYWEKGYMHSIDIMHDKLGYYIAWGILCFVGGLYPTTSLYLVSHPIDLPPFYAAFVLTLGIASLLALHEADEQRQRVRRSGGTARVFGYPPEVITARYETADGENRSSLLLCSGFWGPWWARHSHYLFEWTFNLCWSGLCAGVWGGFVPYCFPVFLGILLFDRSFRDDVRCSMKYGKYWEEYKRRVPYQIVPFLF